MSPISTPPHEFRIQMDFLKRINAEVIPLCDVFQKDLLQRGRNRRAFAITFDDGYENNYTHAFPVLREFGFTATFFITISSVRGQPTWLRGYIEETFPKASDEKHRGGLKLDSCVLSQMNPPRLLYTKRDIISRVQGLEVLSDVKMMSWHQIEEMSNHGMDFGAHSLTHPLLTNLSVNRVKDEIIGSKVALEQALGRPVEMFSYPYGRSNGEVARVVEEAKFVGGVTADIGVANEHNNPYLLPRLGVRSLLDLKLYSSRAFNWYLALRRRLKSEPRYESPKP